VTGDEGDLIGLLADAMVTEYADKSGALATSRLGVRHHKVAANLFAND
jgi:hypothetical protein